MSRIAILGATGTLGQELTRQILDQQPSDSIIGISRCELKQKESHAVFDRSPRVKYLLGDIRDEPQITRLLAGCETVFHVAALKHIDTIEDNPEESVKTNVLGTINACNAAERAGVKYFVFSSTDKAVDPVNVYGMCKGISERIVLSRNESQTQTAFRVYRWGNVLGSRGSAIHTFINSLIDRNEVGITHPYMTRFWIRIEDAVKFMLTSYKTGLANQPMIPEMKGASVERVITQIAGLLNRRYALKVIGLRKGEKVHEALQSLHHNDGGVFSNSSTQFSDRELYELLLPFVQPYMAKETAVDSNSWC